MESYSRIYPGFYHSSSGKGYILPSSSILARDPPSSSVPATLLPPRREGHVPKSPRWAVRNPFPPCRSYKNSIPWEFLVTGWLLRSEYLLVGLRPPKPSAVTIPLQEIPKARNSCMNDEEGKGFLAMVKTDRENLSIMICTSRIIAYLTLSP